MFGFLKDTRTPEQKEADYQQWKEAREQKTEDRFIREHRLDQGSPYIVVEVHCMTSLGKQEFEKVVGLAISKFGYTPVGSVEFTKAGLYDAHDTYRQALAK